MTFGTCVPASSRCTVRRMKNWILIGSAALCAAYAAACAQCRYASITSVGDAGLAGFESQAEVNQWEATEQRDAGAGPYPVSITAVSTELFHSSASCPNGSTCAFVQPSAGSGVGFIPDVVVMFDTPTGVGTFDLVDLHAVVCDIPCASLTGTLVVTQMSEPCTDDSCDSTFAAKLTIASTSSDAGPSISGEAMLLRQVTIGTAACGSNGG